MARKNEAEQLLREGLCPSEIAGRMGISVKSVIQYLRTRVGEGALRLSDLYFSWPPEKREILQKASLGKYPDDRLLSANGLCRDDLELLQSLGSAHVFRGDLYEYVSTVEVGLHRFVRVRLERKFGLGEHGWWSNGIPHNIQEKCASRRKEDDEPCEEPYSYTTLIELWEVIRRRWDVFESGVPKEYRANQEQLKKHFLRLNRIRNAVMHPVKERKWSEDDFVFVRRMCELFGTQAAS